MGAIATPTLRSWGYPEKGTKSNVATSPLPSRGPKIGQNCCVAPTFFGVPKRGDKIRSGYITPTFSGGGGLPLFCATEIFQNTPRGVALDVHKCVFVHFWGMQKDFGGVLFQK